MKLGDIIDNMASVKMDNRLLKMSLFVVVTANILLLISIFVVLDKQRTIIIFPGNDNRAEITGSDANDYYVNRFAKYTLGRRFSFTPSTVENEFAELLSLYSPTDYASAKSELTREASNVLEGMVTSSYFPHKIKINRSKKFIEVSGLRQVHRDDMLIDDLSGPRNYLIRYSIRSGMMRVESITEKLGVGSS